MTIGFDLDHVALAAADTSDALRFLTGELAGTVIFGGQAIGYRPMQVWVGTAEGDGLHSRMTATAARPRSVPAPRA